MFRKQSPEKAEVLPTQFRQFDADAEVARFRAMTRPKETTAQREAKMAKADEDARWAGRD